MVDSRNRAFREGHLQLSVAQNFKRLRTGDFMNQVQPNKQLRLAPWQILNGMKIPDFVEQISLVGH